MKTKLFKLFLSMAMPSGTLMSIIILSIATIFLSCNGNNNKGQPQDSMNSGELTVYCEEGLWKLMSTPFKWYSEDYKQVRLTTVETTARDAMSRLLAGKARVIVVGRDYLRDEDSLMQIYKVPHHIRFHLADDALVFFTNKKIKIDTISADVLFNFFTNKESVFPGFADKSKRATELEFAIKNNQSSEYANFIKFVVKEKKVVKKFQMFSSTDSLKSYIQKNYAVGICYLSQIALDTNINLIKISFVDSTGKYINPKPVHQAYVLQNLYPYKIPLYAYLLENRIKSLPYWFATFLGKETKVQKYFLNSGIVPAFAKIKLIPEEN